MKHLSIVIAISACIVTNTACKKSSTPQDTGPKVPKVVTLPVTNITSSSATGGGYCYDNGGDSVSKRGVCYGFLANIPVYGYGNTLNTFDGGFCGVFSSSLTPLLPNTTYYVRAYAENKAGWGYGDVISFKTLP